MRNKKKLYSAVALLTAATLIFSACGKTAGGEKEAGTNQASTPKAEKPTVIKLFASNSPDFDPETYPAVLAVEKKLNIDLQYEIPPASSYNERQQVMLVSGEYPDVVMFESHTSKQFVDAVKNGIVIPVTKWVNNAKNLQKYTSSISWDSMKAAGNNDIYGIPRSTPFRSDGFAIRKDWMDALGIKLPADNKVTLDDVYGYMKAFTKNDPDKNGKDDTYGMVFNADSNGNLAVQFLNAFDYLGWQKAEGEAYPYMDPKYAKKDTRYKQALEFTAKLWKEGLIDPNTPLIKNGADVNNRYMQGAAGVKTDFGANVVALENDMKAKTSSADLSYIFVKNSKGEVKGGAYGTGYWWLSSLTKTASGKEEKIINFFDYMLSDEGWILSKYGPEGVTWNMKEGKREFVKDAYDKFSKPRNSFTMVRRNDDADFFLHPTLSEDVRKEATGWVDTAIKTAVPSMDRGFRPSTADKPAFIDYNKKLDSVITKVILGAEPITSYDKALDDWYKNGGEDYIKEMNEYIKKAEGK